MTRDAMQFLATWMFIPIVIITIICGGIDMDNTIKITLIGIQMFLLVVQIICAIFTYKG